MKTLSVGNCPICAKRIWEFKMSSPIQITANGLTVNWRPLPVRMNANGAHFWVLQTDGSRMAIAICKACLSTLTDEQVKTIFADIIFTKLSQVKGQTERDYKLYDRIRTIEVWRWFLTEDEVRQYLKEKVDAKEHNPSR